MNCILIILATIAFLVSIFNTTNLKQNSAEIQTIDIGSIAFYLRFLAIGEKSTTLELAFHNWGLALAYNYNFDYAAFLLHIKSKQIKRGA